MDRRLTHEALLRMLLSSDPSLLISACVPGLSPSLSKEILPSLAARYGGNFLSNVGKAGSVAELERRKARDWVGGVDVGDR